MPTRTVNINRVTVSPEFKVEDAKKARRSLLPSNSSSSEIDQIYCAVEQRARIKEAKFRLSQSSDQVMLHVEKRISLFFLQLIACYNTRNVFHEAKTLHQGFNAKSVEKVKFNAAHSATNPNLSTDGKIYLYRSHLYDESNATLDLPKEVNDADRAIDEKYRDSFLRRDSIALLNRTSQGLISPVDATKEFVALFLRETNKFISTENEENVVEVLKVYKRAGETLSASLNQPNSPQFETWLHINLENPLATSFIDQYQKEEEFDKEACLKFIKDKINHLRSELLEERSSKRTARAPTHFRPLFILEIFNRLNEPGKEIVSEAVEQNYQELRGKTYKNAGSTRAILAKNSEKISRVIHEILPAVQKAWGSEIETDELLSAFPKKRIALSTPLFLRRFEVIQADLQTQSTIKSQFDEAFQKIQRANSRTPNLHSFFYSYLLSTASPTLQLQLSKLLNLSCLTLLQTVRELQYNQSVHKALAARATPIQKLAGKIKSAAGENRDREKLQRKITRLFNDINHTDAKRLFHMRLYDVMETNDERNFLSGLIGKSFEETDAWIKRNCTKIPKAKSLLKQADLNKLIHFATREIEKLQRKVRVYQGGVFQALRVGHGLSFKGFVLEYLKNHPKPMSDGTAHSLENGTRIFEPELVQHLAEFFGVMESIFYPSTFSQ